MREEILWKMLGRERPLFLQDIEVNSDDLSSKIRGARILVVGAAGTIGGAFTREVAKYSPRGLCLIDLSENNLVETVRNLRSSNCPLPEDFQTLAIDFRGIEFDRFLKAQESFDYVANFAALKHVRSERDPFTLMRMVDTNVLAFEEMLGLLAETGTSKVFSVSSDKAVNPANAMGASKMFMEQVLAANSDKIPYSTARFANVLFSDGSLPAGFEKRLALGQPISAPSDVVRYFVTEQEAGRLCTLACFLGGNGEVFFPRLDPEADMRSFSDIAEAFLKERDYEVQRCDSEEEARRKSGELTADSKRWPCYFSASDTTGEKMFEEFHAEGAAVDLDRFHDIGVTGLATGVGEDKVKEALARLREIRTSSSWSKQDIIHAIQMAVPDFVHEEKLKNLDKKM